MFIFESSEFLSNTKQNEKIKRKKTFKTFLNFEMKSAKEETKRNI